MNRRPSALIGLLRRVGVAATHLGNYNRGDLRRGRRCVGCGEATGETFVPVLGWVCPLCYEVVDIVWEKEISETRRAREKIAKFLSDLAAVK